MTKPNLLAGIPTDYVPVVPNDSTDNLPDEQINGLYVEVAGDIVVRTASGNDRTIPVAATSFIPMINPTRVLSTGTTATGIFALVA